MRFLARCVDLLLPLLLIRTLLAITGLIPFVDPGALSLKGVLTEWLVWTTILPLTILLDSLVYFIFGATLGKQLLGLRTTKSGSRAIGRIQYFQRNVSVWLSGLGAGLPIVSLLTIMWQYNCVVTNGRTSYDKPQRIKVVTGPVSWRKVTTLALLALLGLGLFVSLGFVVLGGLGSETRKTVVNPERWAGLKDVALVPTESLPVSSSSTHPINQPISPLVSKPEAADATSTELPTATESPPSTEPLASSSVASAEVIAATQADKLEIASALPQTDVQNLTQRWANPLTGLGARINDQWQVDGSTDKGDELVFSRELADAKVSISLTTISSTVSSAEQLSLQLLGDVEPTAPPVQFKVGELDITRVDSPHVANSDVLRVEVARHDDKYVVLQIAANRNNFEVLSAGYDLALSVWATF